MDKVLLLIKQFDAEEEEEEEELLVLLATNFMRSKPQEIFCKREDEGFQNMLIKRHLLQDGKIFKRFFRLNIEQFNFVLGLIESDIKKHSCGLIEKPINPEEKLGITLR
ncbi:hypothetical protein ABEB36_015521 [Hypothenemus hampei]|uniref:Uncharacterized protein n=1 Tax=Hypothenemus hampei TaxID=57062 RepID=A0ABD1E4A0_HYPHA